MRSGQFVCHSFCQCVVQDYCKSSQPVSLELGIMIGPTRWKNLLTFGGDAFPDMDSGSVFHFRHHCGMGHF